MLNPDRRASVPGSHHISEANFWPESVAGLEFPDRVHVLDSTLRKTYFTAGNVTSQSGYLRIAEALVELGIETTCLNVTWGGKLDPTPQDWELMTTVLDAGLPLEINVWSDVLLGNGRDRGPVSGLDALHRLVDAGATTVAPGIVQAPDSEAEKQQADDLAAYLVEADRLGIKTTVTLAGVGLRDFDRLVAAGRLAVELGAVRLDLMDSTSSLSPEAMREFVRRFRAGVGEAAYVTMHMHDEFGLATAGALAAVGAGAHPDVSVNGMSYRCGFAPLEEVVLALETLYGVDTGLDLSQIARVSRIVAEESQLPVPQLKPLTGSYAYLKHLPGDAAAAIRVGDAAFPPISHGLVPGRMGTSVTWVWGGFSSDDETVALAESLGFTLTAEEVTEVRRRLDEAVAAKTSYPRWLEPAEASARLRQAVAALRGEAPSRTVAEIITAAVPSPRVAARVRQVAADRGLSPLDLFTAADSDGIDRMARAVSDTVAGLTPGELIDLLGYFKRFDGGQSLATVPESEREEAEIAGSAAADRSSLRTAAEAYQEHFGFPPVVRAQGRTAAEVAEIVRTAITSAPAVELDRARTDVAAIVSNRVRWAAESRRG